ncbi:MAG TPA: HTTM domain-containing protein [Candidatus Limnocylindria bacterium]|jgi:predicted DCC family thiol-disulfide oxidoreductase YuxK|nr:HTTM domain-containing protein [Candidatus Limnocylindria bacterium]
MSAFLWRIAESRAPARPLALARIGAAAAMLLELPNSGGTLLRLADPSVIHAPYLAWTPRLTEPMAWALIGLWLVSALALMLGWRARWSGAVLTATLATVLFADQQTYSNHLFLMLPVAGLLTVADSGAAISLDARRVGSRDWVAGWPVWLLCGQVVIVYAFAALSKMNPDFLSGSVVASYLRRDGVLAIPGSWRSFEPMFVLSLLAVSSEAFLALSLWSSRRRPAAMVIGLGLHGFITGWLSPTMSLLVFSVLMVPLYLPFLDVEPAGRVVVWDDGCGFCEGWVRWFRRLDWMHGLRFVPRSSLASAELPVDEDAAARALQFVPPHGRVRGGFAAVTRVLELLPVSFLWAPLLRLPPVAAIGERVYRRVAANRSCELPLRASGAPAESRRT